ncbi:hypothetical protein BJ944DRAFT_258572, partial [Cunninghamella echinulata]
MSSVSSYEGSEKELFHQRTWDGLTPRQAYLRKTDLLDAYDNTKSSRDTDTWSVAATVDDQESVISTNTQKSRLIQDAEEEDDNMILDGIPNSTSLLNSNNSNNHNNNNNNNIRFELEDDIGALDIDTIASQGDDEKYARSLTSRSVAAEYGDRTTDGFGSELSLTHDDVDDDIIDDDHSSLHHLDENNMYNNNKNSINRNNHDDIHHSDGIDDDMIHGHDHLNTDNHSKNHNNSNNHNNTNTSHHNNKENSRRHHKHHHHHHSNTVAVDDCIRAPTEPQPSIATVDKSYSHLLEENEILQAQLRQMEITTKQQQEIISTLQSHHQPYQLSSHEELNSAILSQQLTKWAELVAGFAKTWTKTALHQRQVEEDLFHHVLEYYLHPLPFGTENQVLLNTAYQDQLTRFHSTLGASFAKWYRRQTVQSLARNPATQDYLHAARMLITQHICHILDADPAQLTESTEWQSLLDHCARLSLELHGGENDVIIRSFPSGTLYNQDIMTAIDDDDHQHQDSTTTTTSSTSNENDRHIKLMLCPLFIDEDDNVLLPARVIL